MHRQQPLKRIIALSAKLPESAVTLDCENLTWCKDCLFYEQTSCLNKCKISSLFSDYFSVAFKVFGYGFQGKPCFNIVSKLYDHPKHYIVIIQCSLPICIPQYL